MAEQCFNEARITDELSPSSMKKYISSLRIFFAAVWHKGFAELNNGDFDRFIIAMKKAGAGNSRIANIIASMKWIITRLQRSKLPSPISISSL